MQGNRIRGSGRHYFSAVLVAFCWTAVAQTQSTLAPDLQAKIDKTAQEVLA